MYHVPEHNMRVFDSITEMALWADENQDKVDRDRLNDRAGKFTNHQDWSTVRVRCAMGYDASVEEARKLMGQLEHSVSVSTQCFEQSVAGFFPNVPEYLAGDPECMWDSSTSASDTAPLSIYVDLTCSSFMTADQMRKRGVAVLALTMLLSQVRPVSLHVCTVMGAFDEDCSPQQRKRRERYSVSVARIETAPLDLTRAAYAMTDVAVARRLFYSVGKTNDRWPDFRNCEHGFTMRPEYIGRVRDILGADGETLYIPSVSSYYGTEAAQMCEQPVEWLNAKLQEFGGVTAEA